MTDSFAARAAFRFCARSTASDRATGAISIEIASATGFAGFREDQQRDLFKLLQDDSARPHHDAAALAKRHAAQAVAPLLPADCMRDFVGMSQRRAPDFFSGGRIAETISAPGIWAGIFGPLAVIIA